MSIFLPDHPQQPQDGVAAVTPANPETTQEDVALMQRILSAASRNPNLIPPDFMAYMVDFIQTSRLSIPIGQVFGFSQFIGQIAETDTLGTTTSTSYTDLSDGVGPSLSGLGDGKYVIIAGSRVTQALSAGEQALLSLSINSVAATDTDALIFQNQTGVSPTGSISGAWLKTLSNGGSSSITLKYRSTNVGSTALFQRRFLIALKIAKA